MSADIPRELAALRIYGLLGIADDALQAVARQRVRDAPTGISRDAHELEVRQERAQRQCAKLKECLSAPTDLGPMRLVSGVGHEDQSVRNCRRAMRPTCIDRADAPRLVRGWRIRDHRIDMTDPDGRVSTYLVCQAEFHCVVATRRRHTKTGAPLPERYECKTRYRNTWFAGSSGGAAQAQAQAQPQPQRFIFVPSSRAYPWLSDDDLLSGRWQTGSVVVTAIRMPELGEGAARGRVGQDDPLRPVGRDLARPRRARGRLDRAGDDGSVGRVAGAASGRVQLAAPDAGGLRGLVASELRSEPDVVQGEATADGLRDGVSDRGGAPEGRAGGVCAAQDAERRLVRANADRLLRFDFPELRTIFDEACKYFEQDVLHSPISLCEDGLEVYFKMLTMERLHVALADRARLPDFRRIVTEELGRLMQQVLQKRETVHAITFNWSEVRRNMLQRDCEHAYALQLEQHRREAIEAEQQERKDQSELKEKKAAERRARRTGSTGCSKA